MSPTFSKEFLLQKRVLLAIHLAAGLAWPLASSAAVPASFHGLPASVDAARVAQTLNPESMPHATASLATPKFTPPPISAGAERITFKLNQLDINGASVYGDRQIANLFQNYLGKVISLADLQHLADTITLKYRNDGYILSKAIVPAQQIKHGVATIRVIEGYINKVDIQGAPKNARPLLEAYADHIKAARPLNIKTLERYTLLANDIPGMEVKTVIGAAQPLSNVMAPSDITPGAAQLTFVAAQHTASAYASYDNRGTRYMGPQQFTTGGSVNSTLRAGDQTSAQVLMTQRTRQLRYFSISHKTPLGTDGATLNLSASHTVTNPGDKLAVFDIRGRSDAFSAGVSYPIIRERNQSLFLNSSFDYLNNKTDLEAFDTKLYDDHLRSLRLGASYDKADHWLGINELGTQLSQGLKVLNASKDGSRLNSRPDGRSDYTKVNFNASRLQGLSNNFSLLASVNGQYAFAPLLSAEQFSYGGAQYGQGYDSGEITGDHGAAGKVELRYDSDLNWRALQHIQYFTFYDLGKVWNKVHTSGQYTDASGTSAGLGLRANFNKYMASSLTLSKPLTRDNAISNNKHARLFFSISLAGDTPGTAPEYLPPSTPAVAESLAPYSGLTPVTAPDASDNIVPLPASPKAAQHKAAPPASSSIAADATTDYEGLSPLSD